jgi:hypothetical protein
MTEPVPVWTFPRDIDPATAAQIAMEELREPDLRVQVLSTPGDGITVQIVAGAAPVQPADDLL